MNDPQVRLLARSEAALLERVADEVFDDPLVPSLITEFLDDPRHHLAVALQSGQVVGFASAVHYVHPDKPAEMWINEVGVAPNAHRRGIGRALLDCLRAHAKVLGCRSAWVLADTDNDGAQRFYKALGGEASPAIMYNFDIEA